MEVLSVWFWRTHGRNNDFFFFFKWMIFPGKCVYIFTPSCCKCVISEKESPLGVLFFPCSHSHFCCCWNPSYPAENGLFPLKNICKHKAVSPQTAGRNESVSHISRIFRFIAQISFSSRKCNSHVRPFPQQLARGPVCSGCSANPPTRMTFLPPRNLFLGDYLFFSADLKLSGKDGKVGWTFGARNDSPKCCGKQFAGQKLFFWEHPPQNCRHCSRPFQLHEGALLAGKRENRTRPNGFLAWTDFFFFAGAECQKREERARCSTLCLQKQTWSILTFSRHKIPLSICFESWIAAVPDDFIPKNAVGCFCHKSCGQDRAGRRRRRGFTSWKQQNHTRNALWFIAVCRGLNNFGIFAQHLLWIPEFCPVLCCCSSSDLPSLQEKPRGVSCLRFIPQFQCPQVVCRILHLWEAPGVLRRGGQV